MTIDRLEWGTVPDGSNVTLFTLRGPEGMQAAVTDYGATLVSLIVPDRNGTPADVVLGYDALAGYLQDPYCFGSTIGRCANRIAGARFELGGRRYALSRNHGRHHIHGGFRGFGQRVWKALPGSCRGAAELELTYDSPDREEGYPGHLTATVGYTLTGNGELCISFKGRSDMPTVFNPTNHAYFNLGGQGNGSCLGHEVRLAARYFLAIDDESIPTGEIRPVKGTPMDFTRPVAIGRRRSGVICCSVARSG